MTGTVQVRAPLGAVTLVSHEVKVTWAGGTNQAPVVNAGPDQAITLSASAQLTGTVTDDGLPQGAALNLVNLGTSNEFLSFPESFLR